VNADVVEVEAGFLKLQVSRDDVIEVLPETPEKAKLPTGVTIRPAPKADHLSLMREINLIGRRVDEAVGEVDKFLDQAALASVDRVRIVHGHGMGILKKAIAELLQTHPHVTKFHAAEANEGGSGATIAELRDD
jgi:DNA mismatch repair protein MutS2